MRQQKHLTALTVLFVMLLSVTAPAFAETDHITILNISEYTPRFKEAVRLFHLRYPNVEVVVKVQQDARVVSTGMMAKNGDIDLLMTYEFFIPMPTYQYYASGAIEDLTQHPEITQYLAEYVDRFSACYVDGHLIAIPEDAYIEPWLVNDILAEKMGIELPASLYWTWEDLKVIGEQVLAYNQANGTDYYLLHDNLTAPRILLQLMPNALDVMEGKSHFSEEQYQRAMEAWLWIVDAGLILNSKQFRDPMGKTLFTATSGLGYGNLGSKHYITPPAFSETTRFKCSNSAVMMNANSQRKEEAVYFLSCFFSPEAVGMTPIESSGPWFIDESRHISQQALGFWPEISPENRELWDYMIQRSTMASLIPSIWQDLILEFYPALLEGRLTIPQFLQQAERRADMMLGE